MDPAPQLPANYEADAYSVFLDSLDYLSPDDIERVKRAFDFAARAHASQKRASGEPYITHPLAVAGTVVDWRMDADAVCAALLHDTMEDTGASKDELSELFGKQVGELVDGLSKLDKMEFNSYQEAQAENFRKMLIAMARDLRVVMIKLADRHHNIQTMSAMRADKRIRIARETLEIYAPIALRLGLNKLYEELRDICFRLIHPHRAAVLTKALRTARTHRQDNQARIVEAMCDKLAHAGVIAEVVRRERGLHSIFCHMKNRQQSFSQVLDTYTFRVLVENVPSCYLTLGALHSLYKPVPGKFSDYVALPKANGYQSLHTTLIGPYGVPVEVQIRTREMHRVAEDGVSANWLYKDAGESCAELQIKTHKWLESLLETRSGGSSAEFFEDVKVDLFPDEVYVFTPKGRIMSLPQGATLVDFAYAVHTDVGNHCTAARINHELAPLRSELKNGDLVEIITSPEAKPNPAWLNYVKTGRARSRIRQALRTTQHEESARLGERLLRQELLSLGVVPISVPTAAWDTLVRASGQQSLEEVYADIGLGKRLPSVVARRLLAREDMSATNLGGRTIAIHGNEGLAIQLATCCQPIPGDPIVGSIRKGRGMVVHTLDCPGILKSRKDEPHKWLDVEWEPEEGRMFDLRLRVEVKNQRGVLARVATSISDAGSNIEHMSTETDPDGHVTTLHFTIKVSDRKHLATIMRRVRHIQEVMRITRERGEAA